MEKGPMADRPARRSTIRGPECLGRGAWALDGPLGEGLGAEDKGSMRSVGRGRSAPGGGRRGAPGTEAADRPARRKTLETLWRNGPAGAPPLWVRMPVGPCQPGKEPLAFSSLPGVPA